MPKAEAMPEVDNNAEEETAKSVPKRKAEAEARPHNDYNVAGEAEMPVPKRYRAALYQTPIETVVVSDNTSGSGSSSDCGHGICGEAGYCLMDEDRCDWCNLPKPRCECNFSPSEADTIDIASTTSTASMSTNSSVKILEVDGATASISSSRETMTDGYDSSNILTPWSEAEARPGEGNISGAAALVAEVRPGEGNVPRAAALVAEARPGEGIIPDAEALGAVERPGEGNIPDVAALEAEARPGEGDVPDDDTSGDEGIPVLEETPIVEGQNFDNGWVCQFGVKWCQCRYYPWYKLKNHSSRRFKC